MITYEDFAKLEIKIGKVISAENIPGADKLLKLIFDIGGEERQILAGIAEMYPDPSILIGKEMPVLLNLEPRKMRGEMSNGMILATGGDEGIVLLQPEIEVSPGSTVR
ncbi:methionine--tRNA ligase subunit beta [Candidatus Wolfebacteria bacterium]|nr:MAG: methionine--tRNA ligase subunit beta [Candidatus Wolfebacteria bacterium]